ncbi:MAG: LacI family DNA-binding transcriptional regulator [Anaerolineae bacterium]
MADIHHDRFVTQDDVARQAGVSRSIVSYVINNGPRKVSEETRGRVLRAIKELGYRPNKHAQMLSSTSDSVAEKYIGIILAGNWMFKRPYYGSILEGIHQYAHEKDRHIRFIRIFNDFSNPALFNELIHPNEISGAILIGLDQVLHNEDDNLLVKEIINRVERVVCLDWQWPGVPSIHFDRHQAAYQATQHLLENGRKTVAYIGPDDQRVAGYQQALWQGTHPLDERLIVFGEDSGSGFTGCRQMLERGVPFDGICSGTDEVAIGVMNCLHLAGLAIPDDVAVASIDNINISAFMNPTLTTVDVPKYEMGLHAIDLLISDSSWKQSAAFTIMVPTQLIVRESSIKSTPK